MVKIESVLKERLYITKDGVEDVHESLSTVVEVVKDIVHYHVKEALKEASKKFDAPCNKEVILTCYPIENIN